MDIGTTEMDVDDFDPAEWTLQDEEVREYLRNVTRQVGSLVRSTLGPGGMETMVLTQDHQNEPETVLTADGNQIIAALERGDGFNDPIAALFIDAVDSMQRALGDGTTTSIILSEALIHRGLDLIEEGLHPNTVVTGYALAASHAGEVLDNLTKRCEPSDEKMLRRVARTSITDDVTGHVQSEYAGQVASVVSQLASATDGKWLNTDDVDVIATTEQEREIYQGVVAIRRPNPTEMSEKTRVEFDWTSTIEGTLRNVTVAILDSEIEIEETATVIDEMKVKTPDAYEQERTNHEQYRKDISKQLDNIGVNMLVLQESVDKQWRTTLEEENITVIDRVKYPKSDIYRIARATGGSVVSHIDDISSESLGTAGGVREVNLNDEKWTIFQECDGAVFTLVCPVNVESAAPQHERMISKALEVTTVAAVDRQVLPGAGAPAAAIIRALREEQSLPEREQLAMSAFADAIEDFLEVLVRNAGLDPTETITTLHTANSETDSVQGINLETGDPFDPWTAGVVEPRRVFSQAIETARTNAERLLTTDAVLSPGVDLSEYTPATEHE